MTTEAARETPGQADRNGSPQQPGSAAEAAARRRRRAPGISLGCGAGAHVRHVGIVFVHGIGDQEAGETLLDWGGAIIRVLLDARVRHRASADPVIDCRLDPEPGESRYIELQLPAARVEGEQVPEQHWVMTEAWWAQRVRPPSFGQMARWLGPQGSIRRIVVALLPRPQGTHDPRLRPWLDPYPLRRGPDGRIEEAAEAGPPIGMSRPPGSLWGRALASVSGKLYLQALSALVLVLYGTLRSIEKLLPIGPLRDGALTRPIDAFMLDWFGDVYVLLGDPAQAASVRGRLVDALGDLHGVGCDEVVVVAHSGGAIVSYMTLGDRSTADLRVDRLVTLGEGLNLAWRLTAGENPQAGSEAAARYERLYQDVLSSRRELRWNDFWASQDPAPVGPLEFDRIGANSPDDAALRRVQSHAVWNRLSLADDHGDYWNNDEEFLIPLLRLLEGRPGNVALFGDESTDRARSNRRRRRLSALSLWRQLSFTAPMAAIVVAFSLGSPFLTRAADAVAAAWAAVPGTTVVGGPVETLRDLELQGTGLGLVLAEGGVWVIAAVIGLATAYALIAPPERPLPWAAGGGGAWVGRSMRALPWLIGLPVSIALGYAGFRFVAGATPDAIDVGRTALVAGAVMALLAIVVPAVVLEPRPGTASTSRPAWRSGLDIVRIGAVMVGAAVLILAPFVAIVAFEEVGRFVLGSLVTLAAFQVLARIGTWRWAAWDAEERAAARTSRAYPRIRHVKVQAALLGVTLATLFAAVVLDSNAALGLAVLGAVAVVLLGVSVDVLGAGRQEREMPGESLLRQVRMTRSA